MLVFLMLAGVVIGGFLGDYLGMYANLSWLKYGSQFGLTSPLVLDLGILRLQLGLTVRFTICGLLGMFIAILAYRKFF